MSQVEQHGSVQVTACTEPELSLIDAVERVEFETHDGTTCRVLGSTLPGDLTVSQSRRGFRA